MTRLGALASVEVPLVTVPGSVLVELVRSATETFDRVLVVCAHGGNAEPVARAVRRLRGEGRDVRAWSPASVWQGDAHAGHVETSVMEWIA